MRSLLQPDADAPAETVFDRLAELFSRDVDLELLARAMAKTPTERLRWLEEMQAFAEAARKGDVREAARAARSPD